MRYFFEEGFSYDEYLAAWQAEINAEPSGDLSKEARKLRHYVRYNYERSEHVHARCAPSDMMREALASIARSQLWMVLTENWCGDSAFCLPVIAEAAGESQHVALRILPRDANLDIMDQYLTSGSRSIPKLVAFDTESGIEKFTWGPRPKEAQQRFQEEMERSSDKEGAVKGLLEHYRDGGWRAVDAELAEAIAPGSVRRQRERVG